MEEGERKEKKGRKPLLHTQPLSLPNFSFPLFLLSTSSSLSPYKTPFSTFSLFFFLLISSLLSTFSFPFPYKPTLLFLSSLFLFHPNILPPSYLFFSFSFLTSSIPSFLLLPSPLPSLPRPPHNRSPQYDVFLPSLLELITTIKRSEE